MSHENKAVLTRANAEVEKGNNEGFLAYCTEDVVWEFVGEQTLKGKAAVRQYMNETYIEPPRFTVTRSIAEGDFITVLGDISLKGKDGRSVDYAFCDVWRLRDGKLSELRAFVVETKRKD
ncbi:nuclear transport factor 2 family protein [Lacunimicrobium album]